MNTGSMLPDLGTGLVLVSLFCASMGAVLGFYAGVTRSRRAWTLAWRLGVGFSVTMIGANLTMVLALINHDFSVQYVAEVGSLATPLYFTVVSLWASLSGSILFWGGILGVYTLVFLLLYRDTHPEYLPYTVGTLLAISVFFALLVAGVANPFERVFPVPLDGPGPNPLLQNHWLMAVHPPTLYLGYVGMAVPYAMLCAALFAGRLDAGWMVPIRRWMLVPWAFLTVGIVLGGWWSYGVLGWGGAWAWDPVENASFHPWLTGTAFLHSAMVLQRRGILRIWTIVLGMATFLLTLVGTFMTRSGVFNSVHSFTQSDIGPTFLVFIAVVFTFSVLLVAFREHTLALPEDDHRSQTTLMSQLVGARMDPLGREFSILLQNIVFVVFTLTVLLGTLYPLITEAAWDKKVSVGQPYFETFALPLGLMLVFLMGVGPVLPWGRTPPARAWRRLRGPVAAGVITAAVFGAMGYTKPGTLAALFMCGFALVANLGEFTTPVRQRMKSRSESALTASSQVFKRSRRRFGGHIAHLGVILAVFALALSEGYRVERDFTLEKGQTASLAGFDLTYTGGARQSEGHRTSVLAKFDVSSSGTFLGTYEPRLNFYPRQREPIFTPVVRSTPLGDLYLSLVELDNDANYVVVRAIFMPAMLWLWVAPLLMGLGSLIAIWPARRRSHTAPSSASAGRAA